MIIISAVDKRYATRAGWNAVLQGINLVIAPGQKLGILGRNGSGKSTLIRIISGTEKPDRGRVERRMSVSWPLAFSGGFQGSLTGLDNLRFICRVYDRPEKDCIPYVQQFAELGQYLYEPVKSYSAGMRARLAFALSMVIEFDCYLIDEIVAVGDDRFRDKCETELFQKRRDRSMVIVSHSPFFIRKHCDCVAVLSDGQLHSFADVEEGFTHYQQSTS
jgi:capsular polysaccharide transport system ATP-binding protein